MSSRIIMPQRRKIFLALASLVGLVWFYTISTEFSTPEVTHLRWIAPGETAFMKFSGGDKLLQKWAPLPRISIFLKQAVILAEDDQFMSHRGFDPQAIQKAIELNLKRKKFSHGASTITMQLARNLYLTPDKSIFRKFKELLIALKLERELDKDRIIEIYLNVVEWGDGIYGAEAAANHYFGTSAALLSKHEAAFLAAILPRPKFYDKNRNAPFLQKRINVIENRL